MKNERTVVETKKTRGDLNDKKIGEELLIDIGRYKAHPDCETLICFVYDPEERLSNPKGLESDLTRSDEQLKVIVIVEPS